jgi:hypothetical protein
MASLFKPVRQCLKLAQQVPKTMRYLSSAPSDTSKSSAPTKAGDSKVVDTADPKGSCKYFYLFL